MNGFARRNYEYGGSSVSSEDSAGSSVLGLTGKDLVNGYRPSITTGFRSNSSGYGSLNGQPTQNTSLVDEKDSIQLHLLTEIALSDSRQWTILSQEEVDALKKEIQSLQARVEQAQSNLAIQARYRDAAISMAKLYSSGTSSKSRSLISNRASGDQSQLEAEAEREASERKCEALASELFMLEKRLMEGQRRLLQHTASILQLTHKAQPSSKQVTAVNGMPRSPASDYTEYSNERNSLQPTSRLELDDPIYFPVDSEPPVPGPKSPSREQFNKHREESEQLRIDNGTLHDELEILRKQSEQTEQKLEQVNDQLRDMIVRLNPARNDTLGVASFTAPQPGQAMENHMKYLSQGLQIYQDDSAGQISSQQQKVQAGAGEINRQIHEVVRTGNPNHPVPPAFSIDSPQQHEQWLRDTVGVLQRQLAGVPNAAAAKRQAEQDNAVLTGLWDIIQSGYAGIKTKKAERRKTRIEQGLPSDEEDLEPDEPFDISEPYSLSAFSTKVQWLYAQATGLKDQKAVLKRQIKQQRELNSKSDGEKDKDLQAKELELLQVRKNVEQAEKEAMAAQQRLSETLENMELMRAGHAKEQAAADAAVNDKLKSRDADLSARDTAYKTLEAQHKSREIALKNLETQHTVRDTAYKTLEVEHKLRNEAYNTLEAQFKARDMDYKNLETQHKSREGEFTTSQSEITSLRKQLTTTEAKVNTLNDELTSSRSGKQAMEDDGKKFQAQLKSKDEELESLNVQMVELKTEMTFAKAELEGAYGSRSQRAAEAAALSKTAEMKSLQDEIDRLKSELTDTLREFEDMTRETLASEKEKIDLEGRLDDAMYNKTALEAELGTLRSKMETEVSRLKEELDGQRLRAGTGSASSGGSAPRAGATMLSEQFRATMKEERKLFQVELKEEQARRRKLEDELRAMRKAAGVRGSDSLLSPR